MLSCTVEATGRMSIIRDWNLVPYAQNIVDIISGPGYPNQAGCGVLSHLFVEFCCKVPNKYTDAV